MLRRAKIVFENVYAYLDGQPQIVCKNKSIFLSGYIIAEIKLFRYDMVRVKYLAVCCGVFDCVG